MSSPQRVDSIGLLWIQFTIFHMMHRGGINYDIRVQPAEAIRHRLQAGQLDIRMCEDHGVETLVSKSGDDIASQLAVGSDDGDLHATPAISCTSMSFSMCLNI